MNGKAKTPGKGKIRKYMYIYIYIHLEPTRDIAGVASGKENRIKSHLSSINQSPSVGC